MMLGTGRALRALVHCCHRRPVITVLVAVVLTVLAVPVTMTTLTFETSNLHLLPPGQPYVERYREYSRQFGDLDEIIIAVRGQNPGESKAYAARLVAALEAGPTRFNRLVYRYNPASLDGRLLLYPSIETLSGIRDQIVDHQAFIESFATAPGLTSLVDAVNQEMAAAFASHFLDLGLRDESTAANLRFLETLLAQMRERIDRPVPYRSPWGTLLAATEADDDDGYFFSDNKRLLFILADPAGKSGSSFTGDREAIENIRREIANLKTAFPAVEAGVTGGPALDNDAMTSAFADSTVATGLAFALTLGLLFTAFRRVGQPLVMLTVLAMSLTWSVAIVALTIGHLTVFSVMFISIVIGIGIDYGIYVLFRYDEEGARGRTPAEALDITAARTGPGIALGALTAAGTFYVLMLTDFHGVQELGFVAGTALLMAFVAMLTVFPAVLALGDRRRPESGPPSTPRTVEPERARAHLIDALTRRPVLVLAVAGVVTLLSLSAVGRVGFDYNLLNLQARGVESVIWEQRILDNQGRGSFSALATAASPDELRRKRDAFERLPSVGDVDSALLMVPNDQPAKLKIIGDFAPLVTEIRVGSVPALELDGLATALQRLARRLDIVVREAGPGKAGDVEEIRGRVSDLVQTLRREPARAASGLTSYQAELATDFTDKLRFLQRNAAPSAITTDNLPPELRRRFVSDGGLLLLQIHPRGNIWDRAGAVTFVEEIRSVDPDVTGAPVITYDSILRMEKAYHQGALYAFFVVAVISWLMIRRVRETVFALVPLVLGTLWGIGLMRVFGLDFNLANVWGAPLIIGASAEYGLNVITRFLEARTYGGPPIARSTVSAVMVNGLTTITGFGCMLVAHHRGIWSLGLLLTIGSATSLAASLIVLPALIRLFAGKRDDTAQPTPGILADSRATSAPVRHVS